MKSLAVALGVISLIVTSCASDEDPQSKTLKTQSELGSGEVSNSSRVTGLSAKATGRTMINLTWDSVPNAAAYWIYRGTYVQAIVTSTSYNDRAVIPDTTYTYTIAAIVNDTLRPKSSSVKVTTPR